MKKSSIKPSHALTFLLLGSIVVLAADIFTRKERFGPSALPTGANDFDPHDPCTLSASFLKQPMCTKKDPAKCGGEQEKCTGPIQATTPIIIKDGLYFDKGSDIKQGSKPLGGAACKVGTKGLEDSVGSCNADSTLGELQQMLTDVEAAIDSDKQAHDNKIGQLKNTLIPQLNLRPAAQAPQNAGALRPATQTPQNARVLPAPSIL